MPKYSVTILGTIDGDDPELAYLDKGSKKFATPQDVINYLTGVLADEMVLEIEDIQAIEIEDKLLKQQSASE